MTVKELIEYLSQFSPEEHVRTLIANSATREAYLPEGYDLITDAGFPVLMFELGQARPLDDLLEDEDE